MDRRLRSTCIIIHKCDDVMFERQYFYFLLGFGRQTENRTDTNGDSMLNL